jgi:DNA-binding NtrC family response regulator
LTFKPWKKLGCREEIMGKSNNRVFIFEDDICFREILEGICAEVAGTTVAVSDMGSALSFLTKQPFDLLLLDWHQNQSDFLSLAATLENFQSNALRIALFTVPDLPNVIAAMKSGVCDIFWPAQDRDTLKENIKVYLSLVKAPYFAHSFVSRLAESLTEKAMSQKTSLFKARREFSRTFLNQILSQQNLRRADLAHFMKVSPRTLHRHLSS